MDKNSTPQPPAWAERFLEWYCRDDKLEDLQGDLYEFYDRHLEKGQRYANLIFIIDVIKFFRSYTFKKLKNRRRMNSFMLLKNYFKTSVRSIARNQLFSAINIFGLAVSMSVALVILTLIVEATRFDDFHTKGDQIYRVIGAYDRPGEDPLNLASTSHFMSQRLEEFEGYDHKVTLYKRFGGDADTGIKQLEISGHYASADFFNVFSFELLEGNKQTALSEPNSIVLTEEIVEKLYGLEDPMGKILKLGEDEYLVTGIMKDLPTNSHMQFEALGSYTTLVNANRDNSEFDSPTNMWQTYIYMTVPNEINYQSVIGALDQICQTENDKNTHGHISARLQPLDDIFNGDGFLSNQIGPTFPALVAVILSILPFVIILTACFNYTNLSIARSLRRTTEIGIRKTIGATRANIFGQFIVESVLISLFALIIAGLLFFFLRNEFLYLLDGDGMEMPLTSDLIIYFVIFAILVGVMAGSIPAAVMSKFKALAVLKTTTNVKVYSGLTLRKVLLVFQFAISTVLILFTIVLFKQYEFSVNYDIGFKTKQILNVELQGNDADVVAAAFEQLPEVKSISRCYNIMHLGNVHQTFAKHDDPMDSSLAHSNYIDEKFIKNHEFVLLAGSDFVKHASDSAVNEIIVNEKFLQRFELGEPVDALGEKVEVGRRNYTIIGVVKDFNHSTLDAAIEPFVFQYRPSVADYLNVSVYSEDYFATIEKIEGVWAGIDELHPFNGEFYDERIQQHYDIFRAFVNAIGFMAFLAISIATLGLLGMSVYAVETKIKEISIRKVMGATSGHLVYLLSKGFLWLIVVSCLVAAPLTFILANEVVLPLFAHYAPLGVLDVIGALLLVFSIGLAMIGFQTFRAAQTNPANTLRND